MAAALFDEKEIGRFLVMPKRICFDDWQAERIPRAGSQTKSLKCLPRQETEKIAFQMDISVDDRSDSISMTLLVRYPPKARFHAICRYDIQTVGHRNPAWFQPRRIRPREPHRHTYNPRAVRDGFATDWDKCAEYVDLSAGGSPRQQMERLKRRLLDDLNISIEDPDAEDLMF